MTSADVRELRYRFRDQHGVVSRSELRRLGISSQAERRRVARGDWERVGKHVLRLAGAPETPEQALMAVCLEAGPGAVASHQSAVWLWELAGPPQVHAVTVAPTVKRHVDGAQVHRLADATGHVVLRRGIPCSNPLRALVDFAAVSTPRELDDALDRALASQLVTVAGMEAELGRLARRGRRGAGAMRAALARRGLVGAPKPSVLESRLLRLLRGAGIEPAGVEVRTGSEGRYRLDVLVCPTVAVEVDGFAYHRSPEDKAEDDRRRARLRLSGTFVLVYSWADVARDGRRVVWEVREAMARYGPPHP